MAQIIEFGASPMDPPVKPEDGVIKWVHHQTPAAIVLPRLDRGINRTIQTAAQIDPPVNPPIKSEEEGKRSSILPLSLRLDRRAHGTLDSAQSAQSAQYAQPPQASTRKPLLFIHNLKPHRKTGK